MKSQPTVHRAGKVESWNQSTVREAQHLLDPGCSFGTAVLTPYLGTPRALLSLRITQGEHGVSCSSPGRALSAQRGRAGPLQASLGLPRAHPAGARGVGAPRAGRGREQPPLTSLPLVAPLSTHSTLTLESSTSTTFTVAGWIAPGKSWH